MSFQNEGQVRQKSLLCAAQAPLPSQTALGFILQPLTSRCTNYYYYFWRQSQIYHPRLENTLRAAKTFRRSREGYTYCRIRGEINVHKARHYHSLHLLGDLVCSQVVIEGPVNTPVWRVMADGISALTVHLGYCGFLVFLKHK